MYAYLFFGLVYNMSEENVVLLVQALLCLDARDRTRIDARFITMGYQSFVIRKVKANGLLATHSISMVGA